MIQEKVKEVFLDNNGVITTKMANDRGVDGSTLRKAVNRKDILKHSRGIYLLDESFYDDLYLLQLKYPKGIYSHETAIMLHWLSTNYPFSYHISFPRGYHLANADDQNIKPYYLSQHELEEEYAEFIDTWDGNPVRVTNLEKTIIDMLRARHTTPGVVEEMLDDYLGREDKDIKRLKKYAKKFKVLDVVGEKVLSNVK